MIKKKNQKPIEIDAQFRYICTNPDCRFDYWLTLKQCQTKNFKIVCDCGNIFKPKQILKVNIVYKKSATKILVQNDSHKESVHQPMAIFEESENEQESIPEYLKTTSISILCKYGFTESESENLVTKGFQKNPINNVAIFVKYIIENIKLLETQN